MDSLIIFCAKYLIFLILLAVIAFGLIDFKKNHWRFAAAVVIAGILAILMAKLAGKFYYHPRLFIVEHIKPLIAHGNDNGFPSDHTIVASALASAVYFYKRQFGLWLFGLAVVVGLGRIGAHLHSPVDVVGGLLLGGLAGWIGWKLSQKLFNKPEIKL